MKFMILVVIIVGVVFAVDDLPKHHRKFESETRTKIDRWLNEIEEEYVKKNGRGSNSIKKVKEAFDTVFSHHRPRRYFHERKQNEKLGLTVPDVSGMRVRNEESNNEHKVHVERKPNNEKHEWRTNNHRQSRAAVHEAKGEHINDRNQHAHHPIVHANVPARTRPTAHKSVELENAELKEQKKTKIHHQALETLKKTETHPKEENNKIASVLKIRKTREATSANQDASEKGKSSEHRHFSKKDKMYAKQKPVDKLAHKKSHEARTAGKVKSSAHPKKRMKK